MLSEQFGFEETLDYAFLINDKNRVYIVNRSIDNIEFTKLRVNTIGLYIGEINDKEMRLSIEGSELIGPKSTKNVVEIEDSKAWMRGEEPATELKDIPFYVIIKHKDDYLGSGKIREGRILNYVSKTRRIN